MPQSFAALSNIEVKDDYVLRAVALEVAKVSTLKGQNNSAPFAQSGLVSQPACLMRSMKGARRAEEAKWSFAIGV